MPTVQLTPDLEICYESYGPDDAPPLLLVMGTRRPDDTVARRVDQ